MTSRMIEKYKLLDLDGVKVKNLNPGTNARMVSKGGIAKLKNSILAEGYTNHAPVFVRVHPQHRPRFMEHLQRSDLFRSMIAQPKKHFFKARLSLPLIC